MVGTKAARELAARRALGAAGYRASGTLADEMLTPGAGQVRGLLTVAGNPVLSTPDGARLSDALAGLDFMAAVDIYVNETTRHADVILPPTTVLERDHYDLVFHLLAVRDTARFTPAVFDKEPDQRHDWEIFREITLRTAKRLGTKAPLKKRLTRQARMRLSPTRMIDLLLRSRGCSVTVYSREPAEGERAEVVEAIGGRYLSAGEVPVERYQANGFPVAGTCQHRD